MAALNLPASDGERAAPAGIGAGDSVLVTGASGFLGSAPVAALLAEGAVAWFAGRGRLR